ncbi:MAG TPA: LptF/LptG family permease [Ferruginibacter sp.]|nr:LptF/LptG family permease [Ferruginibacter sp.]HMP21596.1 LptF/LptG family permease [Ferruginibacter sp.]
MKKIDRYILGKFLTTFFFCLLLMTAIVVVIDISEKTDDFVKSGLSAWEIFMQYYIAFIPRIDAMLFPLFVFIAVIFFTAKMAERTEVVAIISSGVSLRRFLLPYWIGGLLLTGLLWVTYNYILPAANKQWAYFEGKYIQSVYDQQKAVFQRNYYFRIDSSTYAGMHTYDTVAKSGNNFFIQRIKNNQLAYNLRADNIYWDTAQKKWRLTNVMERSFAGDKESIKYNRMMHTTYNFRPDDLRRGEFIKDGMTTKELNEKIRLEKLRGNEGINLLLVERYSRDAIPASVIILTLIGGIMASKKVRGGSGYHLAAGIVLSVLYILLGRFSSIFSIKGNFSPFLAAWIPNFIFAALTWYLYRRAAK